MLITIDPYYSIQTYNTSKEALKNNNISFNEFMCLKAPYHWYLELPTKPMMMNFDELSKGVERYVVSIVKPLTPLDQWTYFRRNNDKNKLLTKFIYNDWCNELLNENFIVFDCKDSNTLIKLSKAVDDKIYFIGKYINKRYNICIVKYSDAIRLLIPSETILYQRDKRQKLENFESEFNYTIFRYRDRIVKFASTPYFQNGNFKVPRVPLEPRDRFMRI